MRTQLRVCCPCWARSACWARCALDERLLLWHLQARKQGSGRGRSCACAVCAGSAVASSASPSRPGAAGGSAVLRDDPCATVGQSDKPCCARCGSLRLCQPGSGTASGDSGHSAAASWHGRNFRLYGALQGGFTLMMHLQVQGGFTPTMHLHVWRDEPPEAQCW